MIERGRFVRWWDFLESELRILDDVQRRGVFRSLCGYKEASTRAHPPCRASEPRYLMMVTPVDLRRKLREPESTGSQPWCLSRPDSNAGEYSDTHDQVAGACFPCRSSARQRAQGRRIGTRHHASLEIARHSIPIAQCWCSGLVQGISCPPSRRTTVRLLPERPAPRRRAKILRPMRCTALRGI
jgi:hypothetical protein